MAERKNRVPELDVLRGICILGMLAVHFAFDLAFFGGKQFTMPRWFHFMGDYGHILFILISGICVTLGHSSFRRGAVVFGAGLLVSYVTLIGDVLLGMEGLGIWFGILHLLGLAMMLYPLVRKLPLPVLTLISIGIILLGGWFETFRVNTELLFPLGLCSPGFYSSDYFPLFPHLGWFLLGSVLGRLCYREKRSLLPRFPWENPVFRFFSLCGRYSLPIYLLHQPLLILITLILP